MRTDMLKRKTAWLILLVIMAGLVAYNYWCIPAQDELAYCWLGLSTPHWGDCQRVDSLMALIRQQYVGYYHDWSGRVFVHFLVGFFSGFGLHTLFDFCNATMTLVLVWLIMIEAGIKITAKNFVVAFCAMFLFMWQSGTFCRDDAFAINYLWMCAFTVAIMRLWRSCRSWLWMPVFFVYGWSQESFVPSMIVALAGSVAVRSLVEKRFAVTRYQVVGLILMAIGAYYLCTAPAALERAARMSGQNTLSTFFVGIAKSWSAFLLGVWPAVLVAALAWLLFGNFWHILAFVLPRLEWWLFAVAALGSYTLLGANGFHISCAFLLGGTVLLLSYRADLPRVVWRLKTPMCVFALAFFFCGAVLQVFIGRDFRRALELYSCDPQGITWRHPYATGPWQNTCCQTPYARWASSLFRRHYGHTKDPAFFSEDLYNNLYLNPSNFFARAKKVDGTECFVSPLTPKCLVRKGAETVSASERLAIDEYLKNARTSPEGIARFLPGRLKLMFPSGDHLCTFPEDDFVFTAKDGIVFTIYSKGGE